MSEGRNAGQAEHRPHAMPRVAVRDMALSLMHDGYDEAGTLRDALCDVVCERHKQDSKWGQQDHASEVWHLVLSEEVGEVAEAVLNLRAGAGIQQRDLLRYELVQVAAVAVAWIEYLDRHEGEAVTGEAS